MVFSGSSLAVGIKCIETGKFDSRKGFNWLQTDCQWLNSAHRVLCKNFNSLPIFKKSDFTFINPAFMLDLKDYSIWQIEDSFFPAIG
jgi:hypothetical protein